MNLSNYDWGPSDEKTKENFIKEYTEQMYTKIYDVKEGDVVMDIGASTGIFSYSILNKKPKYIFAIEPSKNEFKSLIKNLIGKNVIPINKAIYTYDGILNNLAEIYYDDSITEVIKFSSLIDLYSIDKINFLKIDCEGGEYDIFINENIDFLKNNVDVIVGEWHIRYDYLMKFKHFINVILKEFKYVKVFSVDGIDITWDLYNDHFVDYYKEVIFHISNKIETNKK